MMIRALILALLSLISSPTIAKTKPSLIQVDMIVFLNRTAPPSPIKDPLIPLMTHMPNKAILLQTDNQKSSPYHLLPKKASFLNKEYDALQRHSKYQVLFSYSWLQENSSQQTTIKLPFNAFNNWEVNGFVKLRQGQYYDLDTELLFLPIQASKDNAFVFSQKQRLKPSKTYYFDHPQAGMLISIHSAV